MRTETEILAQRLLIVCVRTTTSMTSVADAMMTAGKARCRTVMQ